MMIDIIIEHGLEEIDCPDAPPCGWEHWRATGEKYLRLIIGPVAIPLPLFFLGWIQRRFEYNRDNR